MKIKTKVVQRASESEEAGSKERHYVLGRVKKLGLELPSRSLCKHVSDAYSIGDVSNLPVSELTKRMGWAVQTAAYVHTQMALLEIDRLSAEKDLSRLQAKFNQKHGSMAKWKAQEAQTLDPEIQKQIELVDYYVGEYSVLEALCEGMSGIERVLSRELSRRQAEMHSVR